MRLVACSICHAQYDVTDVAAKTFPCRCGETVEARPQAARDADIHRCGACGALVTASTESCGYCGSAIVRGGELSLICPECFARNADDSRFCTACGVGFRPEAVPENGYELPCPVCGGLMPSRQGGGVGINECGKCNGLWVPGEHFDHLVSRAIEMRRSSESAPALPKPPRVTGSNPASQRVHYRKCPECDGYMQRRNFQKSSGVIVDVCRAHGTWLDADELEQIAGFILSGGRTSPLLGSEETRPRLDAQAAAAFAKARIAAETETTGPGGSLVDLLFGFGRS